MHICLYGAFGRHNFGDMLFPHIITNFLNEEKVSYDKITYCDILSSDMTYCGGHNVVSITKMFEEKLDCIMLVGGEITSCNSKLALSFFDKDVLDKSSEEINIINELFSKNTYIIDKNLFKNAKYLFANSIGGLSKINCKLLTHYDFVSTRDSEYNGDYIVSPDCAVLTKHYFDGIIQSYKNDYNFMKKKYIAFQIKKKFIDDIDEISKILVELYNTYNIPIYIFAAGTCNNHDCIVTYKNIIEKCNIENIHIFNTKNIWKICCLIANSYITVGSSLHVRIISFCYNRIRFTISNEKNFSENSKHNQFIKKWDNIEDTYITTSRIKNCIQDIIIDKKNESLFYDTSIVDTAINDYKNYTKNMLDFIKI